MKMKSAMFFTLLVTILAAFQAEAQVPITLYLNVDGIIRIFCPNSTNATAIPNAQVQLRCGSAVLATTTSSSLGAISIYASLFQYFGSPTGSVTDCRLVVTAPVNSTICTPSLPIGTLTSYLQFVGFSANGFGGSFYIRLVPQPIRV